MDKRFLELNSSIFATDFEKHFTAEHNEENFMESLTQNSDLISLVMLFLEFKLNS